MSFWKFLICILLETKQKITSFQILLKLNDSVCHEKHTTRVVEVKSEWQCHIYREWERRTDWNGRRLRGERKWPSSRAKEKWQQSCAQYPPHPLHLSQWLLCQAWAVWQKSSSSGWSRLELRRVWQVFCLTALSSDWQNCPAAGWRVACERWNWRFWHIMAARSKTSQEIVGYWLLGGDTSGLLWCCLKYDKLPL